MLDGESQPSVGSWDSVEMLGIDRPFIDWNVRRTPRGTRSRRYHRVAPPRLGTVLP
jgi:hypothetical protein